MLRVLVQNRPDSETSPGGDTVQMEWTVRFLRHVGHDVSVSFQLEPDLRGYDVVHLFNLTRPYETYLQGRNAERQSIPFVLSSVYWNLEAALPWHAFEFPRNYWRAIVPAWMRKRLRPSPVPEVARNDETSHQDMPSWLCQTARFVFPNSVAEKAHLLDNMAQWVNRSDERFVVTLNGVDVTEDEIDQRHPAAGAFVCAGAIGPRKNQLNLVRAFRQLPDERLFIYGSPSPGSRRYLAAVRRQAGPNVEFHPPLSHQDIAGVFRVAKACVQPSYIETPGLSAMEAAAVGTPIVVAERSPVREYFGDLGHYCDPVSPNSIAEACRSAGRADKTDGRAFAEEYDWFRVLEPMRVAYDHLPGPKPD